MSLVSVEGVPSNDSLAVKSGRKKNLACGQMLIF